MQSSMMQKSPRLTFFSRIILPSAHTTHTCRIDRVVGMSIGVAANAIRDLIIVGNKQNNTALRVASSATVNR